MDWRRTEERQTEVKVRGGEGGREPSLREERGSHRFCFYNVELTGASAEENMEEKKSLTYGKS